MREWVCEAGDGGGLQVHATSPWVKFLLLQMRTVYGSEPNFAVNEIVIGGKSAAEDLEDQLAAEAEQLPPPLPLSPPLQTQGVHWPHTAVCINLQSKSCFRSTCAYKTDRQTDRYLKFRITLPSFRLVILPICCESVYTMRLS